MPVTYRLPENASLGYIEIFSSPWNAAETVITFLGSTPEGLGWVLTAMTDPVLHGKVTGNYAVINRQQVLATDTRIGVTSTNLSATAVPGQLPTVSLPAVSPTSAHPSWIFPAIVTLSVLTVLLLLLVLWSAARKK